MLRIFIFVLFLSFTNISNLFSKTEDENRNANCTSWVLSNFHFEEFKVNKEISINRFNNYSYEYSYKRIIKESRNENNKSDNSILFLGKELEFGISTEVFFKNFPEFKIYDPSEFEIFGRNSDVGLEVYSLISKSNINLKEFDPFENMYVIFVKFKNDSLTEFEMFSGHSDEGYAIADSILAQFVLSKKELDKDLEYDKLYYTKENLEAFSYYYETLYLKIELKK